MSRALVAAVVLLSAVALVRGLPYTFVSYGDWGNVDTNFKAVIKTLTKTIPAVNASFLMSLGDNFYPKGVQTDTDPQWTKTYTNNFKDPAFDLTWYITLGNHDHMPASGGQAEIDYYVNKRDNRWYLPNFYYTNVFSLPNGQKLEIFFLDTILLCPQCTINTLTDYVHEGSYTQPELDRYIEQLPHWQRVAETEWQWLNTSLAASTADWTIACGHYPIYSGGEHGTQITLVERLEPLLQAASLDVYINGHDHTLQHLQNNGLNFFVSGGGTYRGYYTPQSQSLYGTAATNGFMTHTFNGNALTTNVIDQNGNQIYTYTQQRRSKAWERV